MGWLAFKRKMDASVFTFCFYFSGLLVAVVSQSCEEAHYNRCLTQLQHFTERGNLIFATSPNQLQSECVMAQTALACITRYIKKCSLSLEDKAILSEKTAGHHKLTVGICTEESDLRAKYINNLPCLKNMSGGLEYCKEKYDRNQRDIMIMEYEDRVHIECCSFDGYRRCLQMVVETQDGCREDVTDVIDEIATRKGGAYFEGVCADHFERCTGSGSLSTYNLMPTALLVLTFIGSLCMRHACL